MRQTHVLGTWATQAILDQFEVDDCSFLEIVVGNIPDLALVKEDVTTVIGTNEARIVAARQAFDPPSCW
jgi:hypothetical protein